MDVRLIELSVLLTNSSPSLELSLMQLLSFNFLSLDFALPKKYSTG